MFSRLQAPFYGCLAILLLWGLALNTWAIEPSDTDTDTQPPTLAFVIPQASPEIDQFIRDLRQHFPRLPYQVINRQQQKTLAAPAPSNESSKPQPTTIYIALGKNSLRFLLQQDVTAPILTVFSTSNSYQHTLEAFPDHNPLLVSAVYSEPSLLQQIRLVSGVYRFTPTVGLILPKGEQHRIADLKTYAKQEHVNLLVETASDANDLFRALRELDSQSTGKIDAILITPGQLYPAHNIKNVIASSLHQGRAVFGYSSDIVKAGALASVYSDIDHIARQATSHIQFFLDTGELPIASHSQYFDVVTHERVAHSLSLPIPSQQELREEVAKTETNTRDEVIQ